MTETIASSQLAVSPPHSWRIPDTHFEEVLKHPWYRAVVELTDVFHFATVDFWRQRGVRAMYLPITTGSVSSPMGLGSDSSPVKVSVEGVPTYLADSMQFLLEYGCRLAEGGCYYVMPSFRGEAMDDRHLCQFFHSEAEIVGDLDDVKTVVQDYLRHLARALLEHCPGTVRDAAGGTGHLTALAEDDVFTSLTFRDAVKLLGDDPRYVTEVAPGSRCLTHAGEREIMARLGEFTWVTHHDLLSVPFYQAPAQDDPGAARNGDLLFGIGETVGCGERHATADAVREALRLHQVEESEYAWYLRMRELRPLRTSGFGLGVERFLLWALRHDDIRDLPLLLRINGQQVNP
ncbi:asparagine synthetase A [Streptomyces sp. NPDC057509]|uniref:asparagine synthetase A n=1 Tax=Streptomyces sp. NPDC057509 TaxID=3346152 RepID=UPI0036A43689